MDPAPSEATAPAPDASSSVPLARPRPKYFDPQRYSGSGASSPTSSSSLAPPNPTVIFSPPIRVDSWSSGSLSGIDSPFLGAGRPLSLGYEYSFPADISSWTVELNPEVKEADDDMHNPDYDFLPLSPTIPSAPVQRSKSSATSTKPAPRRLRKTSRMSRQTQDEDNTIDPPDAKALEAGAAFHEKPQRRFRVERDMNIWSWRALGNLGSLILLVLCLVTFLAGYPILTYYLGSHWTTLGAFNLGGINASGQVPKFEGRFTLIDPDTPDDAYYIASPRDSSNTLELVFSDEFNTPGRTFYPGDDPYWEAVDLHYWATNNLEWYDPSMVTTTDDGAMTITLQKKDNHDLHYMGGMVQTWNKFCFTGGYVVTNVSLPGVSNIAGLWPALWTMGNLGRAGYGATLEGLWPYSYDTCDVGTVKNQSVNGIPPAAGVNGDVGKGGVLSYLPGQRLSRCTCKDAPNGNRGSRMDHPGPKHSDGTWVGRAAPEIDVFEAQVTVSSPGHPGVLTGQVSQSAQWAPFDAAYVWLNETYGFIDNPGVSVLNTFTGSVTQEATSVVTDTNTQCYEYPNAALVPLPQMGTTELPGYGQGSGCFDIYGVEYQPGFDDAYIQWVSANKNSWSLVVQGLGPNTETQIGPRSVSQEPMYLIANLGMSHNFGDIDLDHIPFPVHLKFDWIRVYQPSNAKNIGCDPKDFPTANYIERYKEAYTNPNLTTWVEDYKQVWPANSFLGQC